MPVLMTAPGDEKGGEAAGTPARLSTAALCAATEGWAVALRLAAAPPTRGTPPEDGAVPDPEVHASPVAVRRGSDHSGRLLLEATGGGAGVRPDLPAIRVFLVDAHEVARRGVATVLAADPHIRVVGEAESEDQALRRVLAVRPDVAVVAGAQLCADLRSALPGMRCLVLEQDASPEAVSAAIRAGASGYLVKDVSSAELVAAVRRVAAGHTLFAAATIALSGPISNGHHQNRLMLLLTERERQLLQLLGEGLSNREIAERLGLEVKTVKNYVSMLLAKLQLANRTQAAVLATQLRNGDGAG
jgi:DNA-binding NarL/FixJ family response regulator